MSTQTTTETVTDELEDVLDGDSPEPVHMVFFHEGEQALREGRFPYALCGMQMDKHEALGQRGNPRCAPCLKQLHALGGPW